MRHLLLSGIYSTIGCEILAQAINDTRVSGIWVLDDLGQATSKALVDNYLEHRGVATDNRLQWLDIDYLERHAGLPDSVFDLTSSDVVDLIIIGQWFDLQLSQKALDYLYQEPIRQLCSLFSQEQISVHYVSSLYVAGDRIGAFTEYDLDCGQTPKNSFESAQLRAEKLLHDRCQNKAVTVYRVPVVTGSSDDGVLIEKDSLAHVASEWLNNDIVDAGSQSTLAVAPADHIAQFILNNLLDGKPVRGTIHVTGQHLPLDDLRPRLLPDMRGKALRYRNQLASGIKQKLASLGKGGSTDTERGKAFRHLFYPLAYGDDFRYRRTLAEFDMSPVTADSIKPVLSLGHDEQLAAIGKARYRVADQGVTGLFELDGCEETVVEDVNLAYWDVGEGPTIIMLAGLLGPESWFGLCKRLMAQYRCIVVSLVGAGPARPNQDEYFTLARQAALVKGLLSHLDITDASHFIAADISAPVMQYYLSRWPKTMATLNLINPIDDVTQLTREAPLRLRQAVKQHRGEGYLFNLLDRDPGQIESLFAPQRLIHEERRRNPQRYALLKNNIASESWKLSHFLRLLDEGWDASDLPLLSDARLPVNIIWALEHGFGSLSPWLRNHRGVAIADDVNLIADKGLDIYEAYPVEIALLIEQHISRATEASVSAPQLAVANKGKASADRNDNKRTLKRRAQPGSGQRQTTTEAIDTQADSQAADQAAIAATRSVATQ
ncbi:MAG: hypothetical protein Tsb002_00360 [Wenzhouxiangellaceae bacterium]